MADKEFTDWLEEDGGGLALFVTKPDPRDDPNYHPVIYIRNSDDTSTLNPDFSTTTTIGIDIRLLNGQYSYGGGTNAKLSSIGTSVYGLYTGSAQRFGYVTEMHGYGMGDLCAESRKVVYGGGPVNGDEGTGWSSVNYLHQQETLNKTTIASKPSQSTMNTTLTQAVTRSKDAQTVTVASTTGAVVDQWIVIDQEVATGSPNSEAVKITAVGSGTISGIFRCNHDNGTTITPALVFNVTDQTSFGQDRLLVNLSRSHYDTGTVASIAGGGFTGLGTTWTSAMIGHAIALDNDDYSGPPFGSGAAALRSWHQILSRSSNTSIGIHSYSVAGAAGYKGKGVGSGGYDIYAATKILRMDGATCICDSANGATWDVGDNVEQAICPYTDVSGFQYMMKHYTPNAENLRGFMSVQNKGARKFATGFYIGKGAEMAASVAGGGEDVGWGVGYQAQGCETGFATFESTLSAIRLGSLEGNGTTDIGGKIDWNGTYLMPVSADKGMKFQMTFNGDGALQSKSVDEVGLGGSLEFLEWVGMFRQTPVLVSALPTADDAIKGCMAFVTDANSSTPGAAVVGSGSNNVLVVCKGSGGWKIVI